MPKYFPEFPKREWTKGGKEEEFAELQEWWETTEAQMLIEMPDVKDDRLKYLTFMTGAMGVAVELDDVLSEAFLRAKYAVAVDVADRLGYRQTHGVPQGREYEWFKKSIEAGRAKRQARLEEFFKSLD